MSKYPNYIVQKGLPYQMCTSNTCAIFTVYMWAVPREYLLFASYCTSWHSRSIHHSKEAIIHPSNTVRLFSQGFFFLFAKNKCLLLSLHVRRYDNKTKRKCTVSTYYFNKSDFFWCFLRVYMCIKSATAAHFNKVECLFTQG